MIVRSCRRTNIIDNPSDGTRQMSRRRAYGIDRLAGGMLILLGVKLAMESK
jgi:threonine/homoserine/homoserine lactone efflux protein